MAPEPGEALHALPFGNQVRRPGRTVLAVHGITASAMAWPAVAHALGEDWSLVALDLRGRGLSRDLPGPWGLDRHVADVIAAAESLSEAWKDPGLVLAGHSMGAYVAALVAAERPDLFSRVVLVDGGVPLPAPEGADPDEVLAATLGPALERLRTTYSDLPAYVDFFRAHPALGPHWDATIEAYVRYDALSTPEGIRSRAVDEAVRQDGRDLLVLGDRFDRALRTIPLPVRLLAAPRGMFGDPPGLLPADAVAAYDAEMDSLTAQTVPDCNHYTILFDPAAAAQVAQAITGE